MIEQKIKNVAEDIVRKSHNELNQKFNQRTKQIRDYVENQMGGEDPIKRSSFSVVDQSGSFQAELFQRMGSGQQQVHSNEDYKTKALKRALQNEVGHALLTQKL